MNQYQPPQYRKYGSILLLLVTLLFIGCGKTADPPESGGQTTPPSENGGDQPATEPPDPLYTSDTVIRIESGDYTYLARVTADTFPTAKEVPVHIFTPHLQRKIGDTLPIGDVRGLREEPENGWGTRIVAAEYFDGIKWEFEWNVQEMEDHYLLPETFQGVRRLEFSNVRFPIPISR
jgi:hypothetical protein